VIELPSDLPVIERNAVRLVMLDARERVLLFHTHDKTLPELGRWWELPGGGIDGDETYREAAVREIREETGMVVGPDQIGPPTWRRTASFRHRATRRLQHEVIAVVRLAEPGPDVDDSGRFDYERDDYFDFRWWPVASIVASSERFYPGRLPDLLPSLLDGGRIDEPFELWS
jgi:8-oxo-dGTP pyrophosphatase MutT (NUDIX family)